MSESAQALHRLFQAIRQAMLSDLSCGRTPRHFQAAHLCCGLDCKSIAGALAVDPGTWPAELLEQWYQFEAWANLRELHVEWRWAPEGPGVAIRPLTMWESLKRHLLS